MRALRPCLATVALIVCTACTLHDVPDGSDTDLDEGWTTEWNARIDSLDEGWTTNRNTRIDSSLEKSWKDDWNTRIDVSEGRNDHPCGDFVFDAWAQTFLTGCEPGSDAECDQRLEWVWARSRQCDEWQEYLLRNHFQHVRRDDIPEPDMHVD